MRMPDLATTRGQAAIEPFLDNIELIIVDNIATLCRSGSENETEAWKPVQEWSLRVRASGRAVLFIHHAGKKGVQRGASAHEDTLSTVIRLARPEQYSPNEGAVFEIHFEKTRGLLGDAVKPFAAKLTQDVQGKQTWLTYDLEPDLPTIIAQKLNAGAKQSELALEFNLHKSSVNRYANRAKQQGLINQPKINGHSK